MVAHGDDAVLPAPRFRRPVDIDFDPVALRVVQIDRLADRMVRPPGEADAVRRHMRQPTPQVPAARQQKGDVEQPRPVVRSEEHTSELQSLMRISYAVFCLTKKNRTYETRREREYNQ